MNRNNQDYNIMEQISNQKSEETPLMVTIRCITYNHEPYIRQCLEGFVMQKTNFRFEAIVHDDASTDGTATIIREYAEKYPDIIKPIYETENQYSKHDGSLRRIMDAHTHGKYIAMCEGDDYWIDPYKLQKQVDFLEANPEYGMVHGIAKVYKEKIASFDGNIGYFFSNVDQLLVDNKIVTLTTCFRKQLYDGYLSEVDFECTWKMGDYPIWLYIAFHSKIFFINEELGVYRLLEKSASHSNSLVKRIEFSYSSYCISKYFALKYQKQDLMFIIRKHLSIVIIRTTLRGIWDIITGKNRG